MKGLIFTLTLLAVVSTAQASDDLMRALAATEGHWEGELYYLDYQSGQRFSIPMTADIESTPDEATVIRRLTWTDPGNLVHAIVLSSIDRDSGELIEAFFREGRGEFMRYEITSVNVDSNSKWVFTFENDGTDDSRPARVRHVVKRDGELMTSRKTVRFLDDDSSQYFERNGSELRLLSNKGP